ncbi:DUF3037 domain-containing protein [uncultured Nocardioides sp.]|uniref:DUF3037 domain-containing protein n=1 Tax=uncultured Nocardioides sp. TaxID=198441 RepID=UPI0026067640|nr:DUF3037 domain-containing protein [uncultured Nocardioides sp.]
MSAAYEYVVLRCVPRAHREEFLNVGVVLHSQDADLLAAAWHVDADRLRALDPSVDPVDVETALRFVDAVCAGDPGTGGEPARGTRSSRFGYLKAPRSTVLRPGPVHGGVADDPQACLERLLEILVR